MRVFAQHLYEYNKGLRRLVLHTTKAEYREIITGKLERRGIAYIIQPVTDTKINIFFGADYCIDVLKSFPKLNLRKLTCEQDFILGAMLGYDLKMHCKRYLSMINDNYKAITEAELIAV